MDGYIDDDDDDDGVDDDIDSGDDIDGGDAVGVFSFFLLAPGGGGDGDGEAQSVSRSLVEVAEGTEKAAVAGSRLEAWMDDTFPSLEVYVNVGYGEDGRRIIALPPH